MEGEIARSIRMLTGVRAARVHLVLPHHTPFSRDQQAAQASVVLTMAGNARLDAQGVQAVLNLVAAAVPGLKPQGIAVIDSRGTLLARAGQPSPDDAGVQTGEEIRRATETKLSHAIEDMLERSLGPGHVRAEASVEMNFEHVNETTENLQSGSAGGAQHANGERQPAQHRRRKIRQRRQQPAQRRCRRRRPDRQHAAAHGRNHQL